MKNLTKYLKDNRITFKQLSDNTILLDEKEFELIKPDEDGLLFDDNFTLINDKTDKDGYVYQFGSKWYYMYKGDEEKPKLNPLKYIGKTKQAIETNSFLGIRGAFELLNGSRLYKDWCKKAKFLGCSTLGICEKNTLAGVLKFQLECDANGIKPIIGETVTILRTKDDFRYDVKVYAKNESGWANILLLNKELNVINYKFVREERFLQLTEGLFIVVDPKSLEFEKIFPLDLNLPIYYQLDPVEYENNDRDKDYLLNLKKYVRSDFKPIAITDAFYLDKEDSYIKPILNSIGKFSEYKSNNQHFKSKEEYFYELDQLFNPEDESFEKLFSRAAANEERLVNSCNFKIEIGKRHLPKYKMTEEEKEKYTDNEDMFWALIEEGFKKKVPKGKEKEYLDRAKIEVEVIKMVNGDNGANGIDYFLILWDVIRFCQQEKILVGHGRGSSAGALCAYLLHITQVDPIKWNLYFERFLNPGRASKSIPDIDIDVQPSKKEYVKQYICDKYGYDQFCYIGTYGALQLKAAFKDLSKEKNVEFKDVNDVSLALDKNVNEFQDLIEVACKKKKVKNFIQQNGDVINSIPLILGQPKSNSIHACATLILPDEKDIYEWIPVRAVNRDGRIILVSEWSGKDLEKFGGLKEDILVIDQLDKYADIFKILKEKFDVDVDMYSLPLDDEKVLDYFRKGYCQDVFQFGTSTFIGYLQKMQPDNFDELVDAVALIRPGAMEVNSHNEYILRKFGERETEYKFGTEKITKKTKGLLITQEQVMLLCQSLGGFTMAEADDVRKAIGSKNLDLMEQQKVKFIKGALKNGCPEDDANDIWHDIEVHGSYSFNLSHSVSYTHVSWVGMYLKVYYPIVFWSVAIDHDKKGEETPNYISEINKTGVIKIMPPDINSSYTSVYTNFDKKIIYWALSAIKNCGETSTNQIIEEREKNGQFFSLEEFIERHIMKGSKVNKRVLENLILSGAFDEIEDITNPVERLRLINQYRKRLKGKQDEEKDIFANEPNLNQNWWWTLRQKQLSGVAFFDYEELCNKNMDTEYIGTDEFFKDSSLKSKCSIGGYVTEVVIRESKKGKFAKLTLESNYVFTNVLLWSEQFDKFEKIIESCEKSIVLVSGTISYDNRNKTNQLQSNEYTEFLVLN